MKEAPGLYQLLTLLGLQAIIKDFPNVLENPLGFAKEFNLVIQICKPGYSDLY